MRNFDREISEARKLRAEYARRREAADDLVMALHAIRRGDEAGYAKEAKALAVLASPMARLQPNHKPKTRIYEEVLRDAGRPLHVSDIAAEALARGAIFKGRKPQVEQVRSSLGGSKRFVNTGGNNWTLA